MKGKVYLVGAGPGRGDLITVRGMNILKGADVVIYDYLIDEAMLENAKNAELICCDKNHKKTKNLMVKKAKEGKRVVRLKNGDPSIFGRFSEELEALGRERIEFEVIPGVTAASAASCLSGISLTDRRYASSVSFVTGREDVAKKKSLISWESIAKNGTVVLYMAVGSLNDIVRKLVRAGKNKDTAVAIIENASLPTQRIFTGTLKDIAIKAKNFNITPPAVIIAGETAKLEKRLIRLNKKRVLFTGLSQERFFLKGTYVHLPLIEIKPMGDYRIFDSRLKNIRDFDWIVFASRYGVEYFFKRLRSVGLDSRTLNGIKIAAIGNSTKNRLLDFGILADLAPQQESSKGLVDEFRKTALKGKKIFMPRSNISDKGLEKRLKKLGARVTTAFAYKNAMPDKLPDLDLSNFDEIMFTSPSTVRNFRKRYKKIPINIKIRCIGNVTLREAKKCRILN